VEGVARDFNGITHADLFEVLDAKGHPLASAGRDAAPEASQSWVVGEALSRSQASGVIAAGGRDFQATATAVIAGGRVVGVLLLGAHIGQELAERLRELTRSDVSFLSGEQFSGTTLADARDRSALLAALFGTEGAAPRAEERKTFLEVEGPSGPYLTLARPMPGSAPEEERHAFVLQRALRAETAFLGTIQRHLAQLAFLAALAVLLAGILISHRVTVPIQRIVRAAEEIEKGNYDFPVAVRSDDEMGYLAKRFDEMRQHERAYVTSLQEVARLKTEFIDVASHELRTPVSIITGYQEMLAGGGLGPLTQEQQGAVRAIGESATILCRIADHATQVANIEGARLALQFEDHDVSAILGKALRTATGEACQRRVQVTLGADPSTPRLKLDGPRIEEAVANLLRNAIRFTPDGGRVELRSRWRDPFLEIEVRDTGIGIALEKQEAIFEKGFVVRDSRHHHSSTSLEFNSQGLGLGLAVVRGIVEAHGGAIHVESEPGRGSSFVIRLRPQVAEAWLARAA
jgi:signal transduction histidine kinase